MKKILSCFILLCVGIGLVGQKDYDPAWETKIDKLVEDYMDLDIFSGVVMLAVKGKPYYLKAFGMADREKALANNVETRFDIGSMNKSMTKVLILSLVSEGKLSLNDKLGDFLDGFPQEASNRITIEHLLNHKSGFGDYHIPEYWSLPLDEKGMQKASEVIRHMPLMFEPGTEQEYSNAGYVLLGLIAEQVTDKNYYDLIEERITDRLGMDNTFLRDKYSVANRAIGYYKNVKGEMMSNEDFQEVPKPDGGFYSTVGDMLKFYRAYHYGDKLWDENTRSLDEMYAFYQNHMTSGGAMTHAGGFEGANTVHYEILRDQISVLVFANMDETVAEDLGKGILAIIRGKQAEYPVLPAEQLVYQALRDKGSQYVRDKWEELTQNWHPADPKDIILNMVGYESLFDDELDMAIRAFELNTQLFPEIANCWDSYGEGLLKNGKKAAALAAYKKALELDPQMPTALEAIRQIKP